MLFLVPDRVVVSLEVFIVVWVNKLNLGMHLLLVPLIRVPLLSLDNLRQVLIDVHTSSLFRSFPVILGVSILKPLNWVRLPLSLLQREKLIRSRINLACLVLSRSASPPAMEGA